MPLDKIDIAIIKRLLQDSRVSFLELAKELKIPDTTVHYRVNRLQKLRVLKGFTARVDPWGFGLPDVAFIKLKIESELAPHLTNDRLEELAEEFGKLDEVKFIGVSIETAELLAMVATNDRRETNKIAEIMEKSGGVERIELSRVSSIAKGYFPL